MLKLSRGTVLATNEVRRRACVGPYMLREEFRCLIVSHRVV